MIFFKYKTPILLLLLSFFTFGFSSKVNKISSDDILLKSRSALLAVKTVSYDCNFTQKFAGGKDTLKTVATIALEKKNSDTLLGCTLKMSGQFNFYSITFKTELFYNGKKNIALNHTRKKATIDTIGARGKGKPTIDLLKQNFPTANLMNHYSEKLPFESFFKNSYKVKTLPEEIVGAYTCYKLEIATKEGTEHNKRVVILFIDKESFLPVRRIDFIDQNKKQQYSDFTLSHIKINNAGAAAQIKEPLVPKDYLLDYYRLDRY